VPSFVFALFAAFSVGLLIAQAGSAFVVSPPASPKLDVPPTLQLRGASSQTLSAINVSFVACGSAGVVAASAALLVLAARSSQPKAGVKPAQQQLVVKASPLRAFENELGVQAPVGFWDPAGFSADGDAESFRRRRITEIKHGRVSMIACIGYITPEYFKWPGYCSPSAGLKFEDIPNGLAALSKVPALGFAQIFLFAGLVDTGYFPAEDSRAPGDFKNGGILGVPNGTGPMADADSRTKKLNAELANGRLAMMAIIGMFFQDGLTGSAWGDWAAYTASPLRAFENELGVQDPVGFWDPLGFSSDGDAAAFKRRRTVEIKHGRISMYACIGYMTPEYFKFPGYLSPSQDLMFKDVPNGLAALSKLPLLGGAQIVAFAGIIETTGFFSGQSTDGRGPRGLGQMCDSTESGEPGNYGIGFPNFIGKVADPAERQSKLAAELANGRLAMMAIIGMFFQDGLTGSAWGDWAVYTASPLRVSIR